MGTTSVLVGLLSRDVVESTEGCFKTENRGLKRFNVKLNAVAVETDLSLTEDDISTDAASK